MKTRLLSKLRREAKKRFYLSPWKIDGTVNEVIIIERGDDGEKIYYGIKISEVSCYGYVKEYIRTISSGNITDAYSLDEGIEKLAELRRKYIEYKVGKMREERKDKIMSKKYEAARKALRKY